MALPITDLVAGIFKPAVQLVDELHTSKEEKLNATARVLETQAAVMEKVFDYERSNLESRASIISAEGGSEHKLAAIWRPTLMLFFGGLIGARFLGWESPAMSEAEYIELWGLVKLGIGGYIAGRTGEKIIKEVRKNSK